MKRYANIANSFRKLFPEAKDFSLYRAPGRVNLIGEHTDYNGLPVLPMAIDRDISICASPRDDNRVVMKNTDSSFEDREFEIDFQISLYPKGDWGNYCKAAFQTLQDYLVTQKEEKRLLCGMNVLIDGNIPKGSGLSSSSALVVATAYVINDLNKLNLDKLCLAELLAAGERYVGTEGGGMDQAASLSGKSGMVLKIDFFPLKIEYITFPEDYVIVVCNSLVDAEKSTGANLAYNQRVIECRLGTAMIRKFIENEIGRGRIHPTRISGRHKCRPYNYPKRKFLDNKYKSLDNINLLGDLRKSEFSHLLENVDNMLSEIFQKNDFTLTEISSFLGMDEGAIRERYFKLKGGSYFELPPSGLKIKSRLRHVLTEAERVERSKECIKAQKMYEFGQLMYQSHKSCAEDYEISCPELDKLVEIARRNACPGARLTGAGFGGCTVNLVYRQKVDEFKKGIIHGYYKNYLKREGNSSDYIFVCQPSNGAQKILL